MLRSLLSLFINFFNCSLYFMAGLSIVIVDVLKDLKIFVKKQNVIKNGNELEKKINMRKRVLLFGLTLRFLFRQT